MWNYLQKTLDLPLNTEIIRQAHGLVMEYEKDVWAGEYRKSPAFTGYHIFAPASHIERYTEDAIFSFNETKKDDPRRMIQWSLQICLETLSIPIYLKMETKEFVA